MLIVIIVVLLLQLKFVALASAPSHAPTSMPTGQPTNAPSAALVLAVIFEAKTKYVGVNLADWDSIQNANKTFIEVLLGNMPDLDEDEVSIVNVEDTSYRRALSTTETEIECGVIDFRRLLLTTKSLEITLLFSIKRLNNKQSVDDFCGTYQQQFLAASFPILSIMQNDTQILQNTTIRNVTLSTCNTSILQSAHPTSMPTAVPSCGTGSSQVINDYNFYLLNIISHTHK